MKHFKLFLFAVVISALITLSGCKVQTKILWTYTPNTYSESVKKVDKKISVKPFMDARLEKNSKLDMLYLVPALPFGWTTLNKPEIKFSKILAFEPTKDYANSLVMELRNANLFKDVIYTETEPSNGLLIEGKIITTKYKQKTFSYCTSIGSYYLWYLGCPMMSFVNECCLELNCKDVKTKEVIFSKTYIVKYHKTVWIYKPKANFNYSLILQEIYKEFITDLKNSKVY